MVFLKTDDYEVFHEAEEMLRFFVGMEEVRLFSENSEDETAFVIRVDVNCDEKNWYAKAYSNQALKEYTGSCGIRTFDQWGIKRSKGRAVKFAVYRLLKDLYPDVSTPWGCLTGIRPTKILYEFINDLSFESAEKELLNEYDVSPERKDLLISIYNAQKGYRNSLAKNCVDLYIGIPFCPTRCDYCSFASNSLSRYGHLRDSYLQALFREADIITDYLDTHGFRIGTLYIGGGTPTALDVSQLELLLKKCSGFHPMSSEFTLEAGRPDTIDHDKLSIAKEYGVNRISINPQTMHDDVLKIIGREHTVQDIRNAFFLARDMGFDWINMDLIAGLPGENRDMFAETIQQTMQLNPENITVHTLSIKRSSRMRDIQNAKAKLDGTDVFEMVNDARRTLTQNDWQPYYLYRQKYMSQNLENVGYTKAGYQCRYNINVMEETHSNIALGAGAITKWYNSDKNVIKRSPNVKNLSEYIERSEEMAQKSIAVADDVFDFE